MLTHQELPACRAVMNSDSDPIEVWLVSGSHQRAPPTTSPAMPLPARNGLSASGPLKAEGHDAGVPLACLAVHSSCTNSINKLQSCCLGLFSQRLVSGPEPRRRSARGHHTRTMHSCSCHPQAAELRGSKIASSRKPGTANGRKSNAAAAIRHTRGAKREEILLVRSPADV